MPVFPLITRPLTLNQGGDLKKGMVMVLVVGMFLVASVVSAQMGPVFAKGKGQFAFGLTHFTAHTVDTLFVAGGTMGGLVSDNDLLGFGGEFRYGFSEEWALGLGGFFGFGNDKGDFGSLGETKLSYSAFGLRLGLDHTINVTDKLGLYLGPGFEFASAKSSVDDAAFSGINDDNPRATSFSLDGRIGVIAKVGKSFGLNGSMGKKFSYVKSSFNSDFGFGSEDVSFSRWLSSVNGWAGFVILF